MLGPTQLLMRRWMLGRVCFAPAGYMLLLRSSLPDHPVIVIVRSWLADRRRHQQIERFANGSRHEPPRNVLHILHYSHAMQQIVTSYLFPGGRFDESRLKSLFELVETERLVVDVSCK